MSHIVPRVNILGVGVHAITMVDAVEMLESAARDARKGYVCVTGVHGIMEAQSDEALRAILNGATLNTPDGMPTVWIGRLSGYRSMRRVYGPDLMLEICGRSVKNGFRHFFYGGNPGVVEELKAAMERRFPGIQVSGTYTPPFRPLNLDEEAELKKQVEVAKPHFFWVGLSTPKQERFMASYLDRLSVPVMIGVGAAFDIHAGRVGDAPPLIKAVGLQWLHRLVQEPRRLWKRYLYNNPRFIFRVTGQALGFREYRI